MTEYFVGNGLRDRLIDDADRTGVQADAMALAMRNTRERIAEATSRMAGLRDELVKVVDSALKSIATVNEEIASMEKERDFCWALRDKLRADAKAGIDFGPGELVVKDGKG
jgi:hypothetical protein